MFSFSHKLIIGGLAWVSGVSGVVAKKISSTPSDAVVFGIYEDYMSPSMISKIKDDYQIYLDYFRHDQVVKSKFKDGVYGMSVVSTSILEELISEGLVQKIDWSKLNLTKKNETISSVNSSTDAAPLFSDVVQKVVKKSSNLLDYGIPYFMNKLSFCYVGDEIEALKSKVSWKKLIEVISGDSRFKSKDGIPTLALIEDPRTILSLARLSGNEVSVNKSEDYVNQEEVYGDYKKLIDVGLSKEKLGDNFLLLDSSSPNLVDSLVAGGSSVSSVSGVKGAIMYNADCLYASYGGNLGEDHAPKQFHVAELENDIYFLDFIVLSKNLSDAKTNKAYEFYKNVLTEGHKEEKSSILSKASNDYKHWLTKNFDYVRYTPVFNNLESAVNDTYFSEDSIENMTEVRKKIVKVEFSDKDGSNINNYYESKLSPKTKSDMLLAFEKFKSQF